MPGSKREYRDLTFLRGRTITEVGVLSEEESDSERWVGRTVVLVLDNGMTIYASQDEEGNGPGTLCGLTQDGKFFQLHRDFGGRGVLCSLRHWKGVQVDGAEFAGIVRDAFHASIGDEVRGQEVIFRWRRNSYAYQRYEGFDLELEQAGIGADTRNGAGPNPGGQGALNVIESRRVLGWRGNGFVFEVIDRLAGFEESEEEQDGWRLSSIFTQSAREPDGHPDNSDVILSYARDSFFV